MRPRAVKVLTDVAALDRPFDYRLGENHATASAGDRVRVDLNHRSVRGWIVGDAEDTTDLKTVAKWLGYGPPSSMLDVLRWAGERWYGPWSRFLLFASPDRVVTSLPIPPPAAPLPGAIASAVAPWAPGVWQVAPLTDPLGLVLRAYEDTRERPGSLLVVVPSVAWARRLSGRLEQRGLAVATGDQWERARAGWPLVVGARGTALAPVERVAGAVVIDADDDSYRSSAVPTWDVVTMLRERCRRDDAPLWATSVLPSPALLNDDGYHVVENASSLWPRIDVLDRRVSDPHDGVLVRAALEAAHDALDTDEPVAVAVVLQRLGRGRLLACAKCGELQRCAVCGQAELEAEKELACAEDHERRARFCRACGSTRLKNLRSGVTTLARDVAAQLGRPVTEVTASTALDATLERVVVGTDALWARVRRCRVVVFVDFDQHLLAPRASAARDAVHAVARAGRLVGAEGEGRGRVLLQTRLGDDPVLESLRRRAFGDLVTNDVATARLLGLAPYGARAEVSGEGAAAFVEGLTSGVVVQRTPDGYEVRANTVDQLTSALAHATRPSERLRVAVQ